MAATSSSNPPASLLTIPCELRNAIYSYVFCTDADDELTAFTPHTAEPNALAQALRLRDPPNHDIDLRIPNNLPLLLTSRQIYAEAHALALHHTAFHLSGPSACPETFALLASPLLCNSQNNNTNTTSKLPSLRHLVLRARISHLRALNETWNGLPFGQPLLHLHTLTLIPLKPPCHGSAYAEVADLSQSHTLAYIIAETAKTLRQVWCLVVRNEGCFSEVVWRLVYRSLVYRIWRWAGPRAGLRFECSGEGEEGVGEGREWLKVWIGDGDGGNGGEDSGAREVGEEVLRLVGGKGEARGLEDIPGL